MKERNVWTICLFLMAAAVIVYGGYQYNNDLAIYEREMQSHAARLEVSQTTTVITKVKALEENSKQRLEQQRVQDFLIIGGGVVIAVIAGIILKKKTA